MRMFGAASELADAIGETFGPGPWLTVDQEMISAFADLTGDRQWVHIDPDRAAREMPGGKTIAHGYLLLSLLGRLIPELYSVQARTVLNYGVDKLRFLAPVRLAHGSGRGSARKLVTPFPTVRASLVNSPSRSRAWKNRR